MAFSTTTLQNAATATGNGTAITMAGETIAGFQSTGTFVATIIPEGSIDSGTTYTEIPVRSPGGGIVTSITSTGFYALACSAGLFTNIRARISAYTSGSVTVIGRVGP